VIYSGGGFSNYFPQPSYQKSAVSSYFKNHSPTSVSTYYNASGRGIPDISANGTPAWEKLERRLLTLLGANYVVAVDGEFSLVFGTSASSPFVASLFANINDARLAIGKKPLGFINPTLYSPAFQFNYNVSSLNSDALLD
jgi:tripeptidyl-peptidase-1